MARCRGITKSGARCKRTAPEGEAYCSIHADQAAGAGGGEARAKGKRGSGDPGGERASGPDGNKDRRPPRARPIESGEDLFHVAVGMTLALAIFWLLRKGIRLPGL